MKLKQVQGAIILVTLLALSFAPLSSQGSLSDQVLRLLDRENTWTKKQIIAANYGVQFNAGAPTVTTAKLYNLGGTLYWSGSPVASGGVASYFTLSGTTLSTDPVTLKLRLGSAGAASTLLHVDGTASVTGSTTLNSVSVTGAAAVGTTLGVTGATTLASVGVTGAATVGTTLGVTGTTTLEGLGVNGAAGFSTVLGVTGVATFSSGAIFGNNTGTALGTIRWTGTAFEGYGGSGWAELGSAVSAGGWTEASGTNTVHLTTGTRKVSIGAGTTAPAFLGILGTTEHLRLAYDATHYTKMTVAAGGNLTFDSVDGTGANNAFAFSDPVTINGNLDIQNATTQVKIGPDTVTNYLSVAVGATGLTTLTSNGAGAGYSFTPGVTVHGSVVAESTGTPLILRYDAATNYATFAVSSGGVLTVDAVGASSAFVFSDPMTINGNVDIINATEQVRVGPDATVNYLSVTVGATGATTLNANGAGAAFTLSDNLSVTGTLSSTGVITSGGAAAGELRVLEPAAGGTDYVSLKAPALAAIVTYTLPIADGTVGQVLSTNGSAVLAWAANAASGMSNPLTTTGQIIYASNTASPSTAAVLGIGTTGQCLVVTGGLPAWGSCAAAASAAGSNTQVQYNNAGSFGANGAFTWVSPTLTLSGATTGSRLGLQVTNTGTGSADVAQIQLGNNIGADTVALSINSSTFTTYGNYANLINKLGPWVIKATNTTALTLTSTSATLPGTLDVAGAVSTGILTSTATTVAAANVTAALTVVATDSAFWDQASLIIRNTATTTNTAARLMFRTANTGGMGDAVGGIAVLAPTGTISSDMIFMTRGVDGLIERMRLNSSGRLGIGTATPTALLHVNGTSNFVGTAQFAGFSQFDSTVYIKNTKTIQWLNLSGVGDNTYFQRPQDNILYIAANNGIQFRGVSEIDVVRITSSGYVGIGTATPGYPLHVVGNIYATGNITCGGTCGGGGTSQWTTVGSNIYYSAGSVGIGTATPGYPLTVMPSANVFGGFFESYTDASNYKGLVFQHVDTINKDFVQIATRRTGTSTTVREIAISTFPDSGGINYPDIYLGRIDHASASLLANVPAFMVSVGDGKVETAGVSITDYDNPGNLFLRRVGPTGSGGDVFTATGNPVAVANHVNLGVIAWQAWRGADEWGTAPNTRNAEIRAYSEGAQTSANAGGRIEFYTTIEGTITRTLALTITDTQQLRLEDIGAGTGTDLIQDTGGTKEMYRKTSSERFKNVLVRNWATSNLDAFFALAPIYFDFKDQGGRLGAKGVLGFSAEESAATGLPSLVNYDEKGLPFSMRSESLAAYQQLAIRNLNDRVKVLEARIEALEVRH